MDLRLLEPIGWGIVGGILGELVNIFELRQKAPRDWPEWMRLRSYWYITAAMIIAGAVLVFLHERSGASFQNNGWLAVNIGASAPLLLRQLTAGSSKPPGPTDPSQVN
jgi:hypothetical protein